MSLLMPTKNKDYLTNESMTQLNESLTLEIIIIAAGNSSRLGQAKQLINFCNNTLLQNTINLTSHFKHKTTCVLGHKVNEITQQTNFKQVKIIINHQYLTGMGSSIAFGVKSLSKDVDAVMILLCDQYLLQNVDIENLIFHWKKSHNTKIIASQYFLNSQNKLIEGAPAIFPKCYFNNLLALKEKGAQKILQKNKSKLIAVTINNAAFDCDTKTDLLLLKQHAQKIKPFTGD